MSLTTRLFNIRSIVAVTAFLLINGVALWFLFKGELSYRDWQGNVGAFNGIALGWLFRDMVGAAP